MGAEIVRINLLIVVREGVLDGAGLAGKGVVLRPDVLLGQRLMERREELRLVNGAGRVELADGRQRGRGLGDQRGGGGEEDAFSRRPDDQVLIALERGAEEGFGGNEEHHVIQRLRELAGIIPVGQLLDGGF